MNPMRRREFLSRSTVIAGKLLASRAIAKPSQGFEPLFDGTSLQGWFKPRLPADHRYAGGDWQVVDGSIGGRQFPAGNRSGSMLLTERSFGDFELMLDVLPVWGCDSGLFLRSTDEGQCIQVMIDYLPGGSVGFLHGQGTGGFFNSPIELRPRESGYGIDVLNTYDAIERDGVLHAADAATWRQAWNFDGWNTLRVRCTGRLPDITTWINDVKIVEMQSRTFRPRQLADARRQNWAAPSAYNAEDIHRRLGSRGRIGLQVHPGNRWTDDGVVRFRNVLVRELS